VITNNWISFNKIELNGGLDVSATKILIQPDDKILLGGNFTTYDGEAISKVVRLNANGSLDTGFAPVSGPNYLVRDITIQPGGKVVIIGGFDTYDGETNVQVARLNAGQSPFMFRGMAPPVAEVGVPYDGMYSYEAGGFPIPKFYVMSGNLPPGIQLNTTTGELHGTPTAEGYFTFKVGAYNYIYPSSTRTTVIQIGYPVYLPLTLR